MSKRISAIGSAIALAAVAVAITFIVTVNMMTARFDEQMGEMQSLRSLYGKLQEISTYVDDNAYYKPTDELRGENIAAAYAAALREAGDKYAHYYTAEEYEKNVKETAGGSDGLGISVMDRDGSVYVYNVLRGSPAHAEGILPGDVITAVSNADGETLAAVSDGYDAMCDAMLIELGSTITLSVQHADGSSEDISVTSSDYTVESVWVEYEDNIAVVRITAFNGDTDEKFIAIIDDIEKNSEITGVVFDLRNNGGGLLTTVVNMLDRLLPEGVIVTETDVNGKELAKFESDAVKLSMPMAVLVNGSTASASELFACALRDYDKADLVGTPTFGKGCVQTTYVLSDGSAICFTTAMYDPPASDNYEGKPLIPDAQIEMTEEQLLSFYSLTPETDPQLAEALKRAVTNRNTNTNNAQSAA